MSVYPLTWRDELDVSLSRWVPTALSSQPGWLAAIRAVSDELQDLEDAAHLMQVDLALPNAAGVHLDRLGAVVGEQRGGVSDSVYRRFIAARTRINVSDGTRTTVAQIFAALTTEAVSLRDAHPAAVYGVATVATYFDAHIAARIGRAASDGLPAGVGGDWVAVMPGAMTFSTVGGTDPGFFNGPGFGQALG